MHVASLHQAEHLPSQTIHLQSLKVEGSRKRIKRPQESCRLSQHILHLSRLQHFYVWRRRGFRFGEHLGVRSPAAAHRGMDRQPVGGLLLPVKSRTSSEQRQSA
jgi:hypothetical protein